MKKNYLKMQVIISTFLLLVMAPMVNVKSVPAGMYLLSVRDAEGKAYYSKIVKK